MKSGFQILVIVFIVTSLTANSVASQNNVGWKLVWSDEFENSVLPDTSTWNYEHGFVRNEEYQWYQKDNAFCENGVLIIEGRREKVYNTGFKNDSKSWKQNREYAQYTASSINTRGKNEFMYGRFEIRARIDTAIGLWPAIWTLGINGEWPANGEIDIMESYPINGEHNILANVASGTSRRYVAKWDSQKLPLIHFLKENKDWPSQFHVWRMDWDEKYIRLYLDNELLNETELSTMLNEDGSQPFHQPHYILLNLAIGGQNGGVPSNTSFPRRFEVDYVRVYQLK